MIWSVDTNLTGERTHGGLRVVPRQRKCSGCPNNAYFVCGEARCRVATCDRSDQNECNVIASPKNWPKTSMALGVSPEQIPEAKKAWAAAGVPMDFVPETGEAKITDVGHFRRAMKQAGLVDRDGYM